METINNMVVGLKIPDYIQIAILIALIWYSLETHFLRKWQKKQVQLAVFNMELERLRTNAQSHGLKAPNINGFPIILRKIYELSEFDLRELYSPDNHRPLSIWQKIVSSAKGIIINARNKGRN